MFKLFKKKPKIENNDDECVCIEQDPALVSSTDDHDIIRQIEWLKQNEWVFNDEYDINKKNILIMDDKDEIISSVIDDLYTLESNSTFYLDDYNILTISSKMAGFHVFDILEKASKIEIDYALLDIILGGKKVINGKRVMIDGIDVAIQIWNHFPQSEILFFSGCIIDQSIKETKIKFDAFTGDDLNNFMLPKGIGIEKELEKLMFFFNSF